MYGSARGFQHNMTQRIRRRLALFHRDEQGGAIIFTLFLIVLLLIVAGYAVDMMRFENKRARLQGTLDRAVLAAADFQQTQPCEDVVNNYFDASNLLDKVTSIDCTESNNGRMVAATAAMDMNTLFMMGVDTMMAPASGAATETVENIEVSLVLDISGSMRYNSRMDFLRPAATQFVEDLLDDAEPNTVSINLVPYAGMTNPGPSMFSYLNGVRYGSATLDNKGTATTSDDVMFPNVSSCLEIPNSAFSNANLPPSGQNQVAHFMNWTIEATVMDWGWCPWDGTAIQYASHDATELETAINAMRMHDGTGTHYGMKWGLALLNPTSQPAFAHLATLGEIDTVFNNRPAAWNDSETVKYIVLMTDGQITEQVRPKNTLHLLNPTKELQYRTGDRTTITTATTNVTSFYSVCNLAKANGVVVFTIAFDAPAAAQTQMATCASSPSHFYRATGSDIGYVFNSIASQINALRLIQ